jgi:hypothetical protein
LSHHGSAAQLPAVRRKQHQKNKKISKDWEITEIIVTIVERQIRPSAVIRRDVNLPVIGSKTGKTRQCDIVIEEGYDARKTILIIEAQH